MGRWTQYDEDSYRLPEGVTRTGYNADTESYSFNGVPGIPYTRYGVLTAEERRARSSQRIADQQRRRETLGINKTNHVSNTRSHAFSLPIYPFTPAQDPPDPESESESGSINIPNAMRTFRRAVLAALTFPRRRPTKFSTKDHGNSPNPMAGVEKAISSRETSRTPTSKEKPRDLKEDIRTETNPSEKAIQSTAPHSRSDIGKRKAATLSHSSRPSGEHRSAPEPHTRSFSDSTSQEKLPPRQSSTSTKGFGSPEPHTRTSHRMSAQTKVPTEKPVSPQGMSSAKELQTKLERSTKSSGAVLAARKPDPTSMSSHTPTSRKVSRSATLPTPSTQPRSSASTTSSSPATPPRRNPVPQTIPDIPPTLSDSPRRERSDADNPVFRRISILKRTIEQ